MRKIITTIAIAILTLTTFSVNAQEKGNKYISGNIGVGFMYLDGESAASFSITPGFSYFITDKINVGVGLGYGYSNEVHTLLVMPQITYYHRIIDNLYYTPGLGIGGGLGANDGYTAGAFTLSVNLAGLEYKPTEKLGISLSLVNLNYTYVSGSNGVGFNFLSSPSVGFNYYF
jgi:hypothetical protein